MIFFNPLALLPLAKNVLGFFSKKRDQKHEWEVAQSKRSTWFMRLFAAVHIIGPIDYAFYLSYQTAKPLKTPEDVANLISTTLNAFPTWWSGAAVTILLAAWGIREHGQASVERSRAKQKEYQSEAMRDRQKSRVQGPPTNR